MIWEKMAATGMYIMATAGAALAVAVSSSVIPDHFHPDSLSRGEVLTVVMGVMALVGTAIAGFVRLTVKHTANELRGQSETESARLAGRIDSLAVTVERSERDLSLRIDDLKARFEVEAQWSRSFLVQANKDARVALQALNKDLIARGMDPIEFDPPPPGHPLHGS